MTAEVKPLKWIPEYFYIKMFEPPPDNGCNSAKKKGYYGKCVSCPIPVKECNAYKYNRKDE
ncbi:hypothetical protein M0R04_08500 [Candidatus Dojkabacteria bacterium]|jgi:hypothetical protein|nr:hypothetical protein [Candidatus Dojkabacteria bacterium]